MTSIMHSHKDLIVWQKAMDLVSAVYQMTRRLPSSEAFGLVSQMRRCSISIPSNIAEGRRRVSRKDFRQFVIIAYSSGAELETQLEIVRRLSYGSEPEINKVDSLLHEVMSMLNKMSSNLRT